MKHFFANFIAMFFISKKLRRRIRNKIMKKEKSYNPQEEKLLNIEQQISEKQHILDTLEQKYKYLSLKASWLTSNKGILPLPGRFNEYDLIFCIGASCHGTTMLKHFDLRRFSTPFDYTAGIAPDGWLTNPDIYRDTRFKEKVKALCDNFKDWLEPENFKYVSQYINSSVSHLQVVNSKTGIRYIHEFPANQDIMQHMPEFIEKNIRRIKYMYDAIDKSQKILIIWISGIWDQTVVLEKNVPSKDIKWAVKNMKNMYPNKIFDFVFFEPDGTKERFEYEKIEIAPGAFRIKSNHFLKDFEYNFVHTAPDYFPHIHVISEMLDNIKLSKNAFKLPDNVVDEGF